MSLQQTIDFTAARKARDEGMARAQAHAEADMPGWSEAAYGFLRAYARIHEHFISEDVSGSSKARGFPQPSTDRAWGPVYRRAVREGVIVQDGAGRSARRHASICPRWRSLVYAGGAA